MLTDEDLRRELSAAFHERADPIARTAFEPAALLGGQPDSGAGAGWHGRGR
jgi:hypothetical protein